MKKKLLSTMLIASMLLGLVACGKSDEEVDDVIDVETTSEESEEEVASDTFYSDTNSEGQVRSYLTGEWVDEEVGRSRPFALMVENTKACLPQYGVSNAGVIYECVVEGSITRMMCLFDDYSGMDRIGNVRSSRPYFVYFASEWEAIYGHAGGNPAAFELIDNGLVDNLNGLDGDLSNDMYYRTSDASAPHNYYTSSDGILAGIEDRGYSTDYSSTYEPHFVFNASGNSLEDGEDCQAIELYYYYNEPYWVYNEEDGLYYRYEFGDEQIDKNNGEQLTAKNIIIQTVEWWTYAGSEYLGYYLPGYTGTGKFITNGKMVDITWSKDGDSDVTHYYYENGEEIDLNIGVTWIQACQDTYVDENVYYATVADFEAAN